MPYKRSSRYKSNRRRKAPIYRQLRTIKKQLKGEWKFNDTDETAGAPIGTQGSYWNMCQIAEGDSAVQRDGTRIVLRSVYIRGSLSDNDPRLVRLMIVHWPQSNNQALTLTDLFAQTAAGRMFYSPVDQDSTKKFRILMDKVVKVTPKADGDTEDQPFKIYKKFKHHVVQYSLPTANETSITQGSLNFVVIPNGAIAAPTLKFFMRVRYTEN